MDSISHMRRALELAAKGRGRTSPNPMVGAVVVQNGELVGEGYHERAGGDHAEVIALRQAGTRASGSDLYVTLEPCSHHGRTPPCTGVILEAGVARVFAAIKDPNPLVSGRGAEVLSAGGLDVSFGLCAVEAGRLNEYYLKYIRTGVPFILLKSALTLDGKIATRTGDSRWVTGEESRAMVHEMRNGIDAILVGVGTVEADDPRLTTRLNGDDGRNPHRIIIDPSLRISEEANVLRSESEGRTIIVTTSAAAEDKRGRLTSRGVEFIVAGHEEGHIRFSAIVKALGGMGLASIMIEGGGEVAASALADGVVDKVVFFIAPKIIGGREAPTPVGGEGEALMKDAVTLSGLTCRPVGEDYMFEAYVEGKVLQCSQG